MNRSGRSPSQPTRASPTVSVRATCISCSGPATASRFAFRVLIDRKPPGADHSVDAGADGNGTITEERLYQLVRQSKSVAERQFEIEFLDSGAQAFAFTFG